MSPLPSGTITFFLTDVEGSTRLWEREPGLMQVALARHDALVAAAVEQHGGIVVKSRGEGDSVFAVFARATDAVAAAAAIQRALFAESWPTPGPVRVRIALHTGEAELRNGDYFGPTVNRAARIRTAAQGGQTLLSQSTCDLLPDRLPAGVALRDLGEHRLRDLVRPERLFQLDVEGVPQREGLRFAALDSPNACPNNLPMPLSPLIGRERELRAIEAMLTREEVRLVTLSGAGGTGKTRLSLQVALNLLEAAPAHSLAALSPDSAPGSGHGSVPAFPDGVYFVPLAPISDPDLVVSAMAQTLGVVELGSRPLVEALEAHLRDRRMLLVLDNFEQIVAAAATVAELLGSSPRLKVLVTSRMRLHLRGEREFAVPPLALPDLRHLPPIEALTDYSAIALFVERAAEISSDFALDAENAPAIAEICHRLDGLPLAIELAAARSRLLPPRTMLARLQSRLRLLTGGPRDLPARQQTLRATIAWSHDLLDNAERRLFRRLAIFVGGCTLDAVEAVCTDDSADVLDGVASLVDKNLVRQVCGADDEPRFTLLETIREFALEQLEASGETAVMARRHAEYYLALADQAESRLIGPTQDQCLAQLEEELGNLRAVLGWSQTEAARSLDREGDPGLRLVGALHWFWHYRGHIAEERAWLETALARIGNRAADETDAARRVRAGALGAGGHVAFFQADYVQSRAWLEASRSLWSEIGDPRGLAYPTHYLGHILQASGDLLGSRVLHEESVALSRAAGDKWHAALALNCLGEATLGGGDPAAPQVCLEASLALFREVGERRFLAKVMSGLGRAALLQGDCPAARAWLEEAITISRATRHHLQEVIVLMGLGDVARCEGDYEQAGRDYAEGLDLARELGTAVYQTALLHNLAYALLAQGELKLATQLLQESLARRRQAGAMGSIVLCLIGLAAVCATGGQSEFAAELLGAAEAAIDRAGLELTPVLLDWGGGVHSPANRPEYDRLCQRLRSQVGDEAFEAALIRGRAIPLDQAISAAQRGATEVSAARAPNPTGRGPREA